MILLVIILCLSSQIEAQLRVGFYENTCTNVESIIQEEVERAFITNKGIAPGLVRMHFHDCFVRVKLVSSYINIIMHAYQVICFVINLYVFRAAMLLFS